MSFNPIKNQGRLDSSNNGLTHENKATEPNKRYLQKSNDFNLSYSFANTERFADVTPFLYFDALGRDSIPYRSLHKLSSYTLQSPMMDDIYKHKFYSIVPYRAILPNTWEIFYANPTKGDDVPDDVYCTVDLLERYYEYFINVREHMDPVEFIKFMIATESIFSTGSLLNTLKYNLWPHMYKDSFTNFDTFFDIRFAPLVAKYIIVGSIVDIGDEPQYIVSKEYIGESSDFSRKVGIRYILDILRSGDYSYLEVSFNTVEAEEEFAQMIYDYFDRIAVLFPFLSQQTYRNSYPIDLSAVIAYQISCMSQVTDPSIDYIFNAQLFRDVLFSLPSVDRFSYNGRYYNYETFSQRFLYSLWFDSEHFADTCCKLFSFAKSLKFGDYFTQMRPSPYGVGDLEINEMNAVEVTRKIVYQRFLNWNNRVGPKYEDYYEQLNGIRPLLEPDEPSLITHSKSVVGSYNVENTSSEQLEDKNSVTTLLRDTNGNFEFDIIVQEPSIVLGLTSYDMQRLYTRGMDRSHLKQTRFDFFNHMLQYIGDQDIKASEIDSVKNPEIPIGYNTRDIHYKMAVSHASGGFITALRSWAFTTEDSDNDILLSYGINPDFIRNVNTDFDRFYRLLTGYSLGSYFHFILKYTNDLSNVSRAMDVAPDIL